MVDDPLLDMLLAEAGCPYKAGTADSVVWLAGYNAGAIKAYKDAIAEARRAFGDTDEVEAGVAAFDRSRAN
jgi:hypothetical protein